MEEKQEYKSLSLRFFDSSVGKAEDCRSEVGILMSLVQIWLLEGTFFFICSVKTSVCFIRWGRKNVFFSFISFVNSFCYGHLQNKFKKKNVRTSFCCFFSLASFLLILLINHKVIVFIGFQFHLLHFCFHCCTLFLCVGCKTISR